MNFEVPCSTFYPLKIIYPALLPPDSMSFLTPLSLPLKIYPTVAFTLPIICLLAVNTSMMTLCRTECYTSYFRRNSRWWVTLGSLGGNSAVCSGALSVWVSCGAGWFPAGRHPDRPIRLRIGWWWSTVRPSPILVQKGGSPSLHHSPWYINMILMAWAEFKRERMVIYGSIYQNKLHKKVHYPTLISPLTATSRHKLYSWPYLY